MLLVKVNRFVWLASGLRHSLGREEAAFSGNAFSFESLNFFTSGRSMFVRTGGTTVHVLFSEVGESRSTGSWDR